MIESCALPAIHAVTVLAGHRQVSGQVIQRRGSLIVLQVASDALRAEARIDAGGSSFVAVIAGSHHMRSQQREPIGVLLDRRNGHLPAANRVAFLAIGPELTPVQIGVTCGALRRGFRKHEAGVTAAAGDSLVQPAQREGGLGVVIEFRLLADRTPRQRRMTVLTWRAQGAMRIGHAAAHRLLRQQ